MKRLLSRPVTVFLPRRRLNNRVLEQSVGEGGGLYFSLHSLIAESLCEAISAIVLKSGQFLGQPSARCVVPWEEI